MTCETVGPEARPTGAGGVASDGSGKAPCPKLNHDAKTWMGALGIDWERLEEVKKKIVEKYRESETKSEVIEYILCDDTLTDMERVFALVYLGTVMMPEVSYYDEEEED